MTNTLPCTSWFQHLIVLTLHLQPSNLSQEQILVSVIYKECWCRARLNNGLQRAAVSLDRSVGTTASLRNLPDKTYLLLLTF